MTFPSEPRFLTPGLKGPCYTIHHTHCCNESSVISQPVVAMPPQRGRQQQHREGGRGLSASGPANTIFINICRCDTRPFNLPIPPGPPELQQERRLQPTQASYSGGSRRRQAGCADAGVCGQLMVWHLRRWRRLHVLAADISYICGLIYRGYVCTGFLVLCREISVTLQWANWHSMRWQWEGHRWLTDISALTTSTSNNAWARSIKNWPAQTLPVGMSPWFLTRWHLLPLTLAHVSYQKLFLWSPIS